MSLLTSDSTAVELARRFARIRAGSRALIEPLSAEDCLVQTMPDVSPSKWHLAHTTWFFESFVLEAHRDGHADFDAAFKVLFNSYYEGYGPQHPRLERGLLSRPSLERVIEYREHVDARMTELFESVEMTPQLAGIIELGLQHEQQHQELMLMDIKHVLGSNPLRPAYREDLLGPAHSETAEAGWVEFEGGETLMGFDDAGFAFDNERPVHPRIVEPFAIGRRLVTSGEWFAFIADGGYERVEFWLADGWDWKQRERVVAPLYWESDGQHWLRYELGGLGPIGTDEPVCHVSFYEADAFARWAGARLPREEEWEHAVRRLRGEVPEAHEGNFVEDGRLHPTRAYGGSELLQAYGDVWEWTMSPYAPYPGFRAFEGMPSEYNGKFMCNQMVLRGGSCVTPREHTRVSYRNFFYPQQRWAFTGLRLARDLQ